MHGDLTARAEPEQALRYHPSKVEWATARFLGAPPSWLARAFFSSILTVLGAGLAYAAIAKVAVTVEAPGRLTPEAGVLPLNCPTAMTVHRLLVRDNDRVQKGQLLVVSQDDLSDADEAQLIADKDRLSALLQRDAAFDCRPCVDELQALAERAFIIEGSGEIRERLAAMRQRLQELATVRAMFGTRGASTQALRRQIQVAGDKLAEIRRRGAEAMLASRVEELEAEIAEARSRLAASEQGGRADLEAARNRLTLQLTDLGADLARYEQLQTITAPVAGTVTELAIQGEGQRLATGQKLMEIVPADSMLVAEVRIANKDISRDMAGMEVRLKLAALPEREFGVAIGEVKSVALKATFDPLSASKEPTYKVLVQLERQGFDKDGQAYPFRFGMAAKALVVSGYKSMLRLALERLLNLKDELLQEA